MIDATADWPSVLYVAMVQVKAQEKRLGHVAYMRGAGSPALAVEVQIFDILRTSLNIAIQVCCPDFVVKAAVIAEGWRA